MALFGGLFDTLMSGVRSLFGDGGGGDDAEDLILRKELQSKVDEFVHRVSETQPYGSMADESYRTLIYNGLNSVPAIELYDGDYDSRLNE